MECSGCRIQLVRKVILKREWWNKWQEDYANYLSCHTIYDTAFTKKETSDYSAITLGVFGTLMKILEQTMLLDAVKGRYEFPELRRVALEQYKYWQPETVIIGQSKRTAINSIRAEKDGYTVTNFSPIQMISILCKYDTFI